MNEFMEKVFLDFKPHGAVSKETIEKYKDKLGDDVIDVWNKYGYGSAFKGYLKAVNPDELQQLFLETYIMPFDDIPVFVTGMGDIIACNSRGSFVIVDYRHQRTKVLWTDRKIRWNYFLEAYYYDKYWQWDPYFEAVEKHGEPDYDECFGYEPLLSLGGNESVENLQKFPSLPSIQLIN
ncbi:T6SS immunity protein Tdi1 domain-containing protein [Cohnella caldifontis]|uniref:T6SS immunity protein Tdi1 domain-containing protein n=1 Tax=Cohnella caldifontis TaxID=3027471 RepID=UPI0023EBB644|nr:T6SS immunity protein Tdi1 domain-containing protein [Cohnella sp. YIM B05605]